MSRSSAFRLFAPCALCLAMLTACGGEGVTGSASSAVSTSPVPAVASVTLSATFLSLTPGQQMPVTATPKDAAGNALTGRTVSWTSDHTAVATVDAFGMVTGVGVGTAVVAAAVDGKVGSIPVTVGPPTYDGNWIGLTSQGDSLVFTIAGTSVRDISIKFTLTGDCGIAGTTIRVSGPAGSVSGQQLNILAGTDLNVSGALSSFTTASGTASYTLRGTAPVCTSTSSATWTAHKS